MLSALSQTKGLELLFIGCAVFGGALFVVRLFLMFIGGGHDSAGDVDAGGMDAGGMDTGGLDADGGHVADVGAHAHDVSDADVSFKVLSLQGITAFLMMFGLVGWAVCRQGDYTPAVPMASGTVAGALTIWIMKKIFQFAMSLQSSGTLQLANAIGKEGTVYLTIHPGEAGKVQVSVQNRLCVLNAISDAKDDIKTGTAVRVVRVAANILVVEPTHG